MTLPAEYEAIKHLGGELFAASRLVDEKSRPICRPTKDFFGPTWGLVTDIYDSAYPEKGRAEIIVTKGGLKGLIDSSGRVLAPCRYSSIRPAQQGLWRVRRKGVNFEFLMSGDGREYLLP